MPLFSDLTAAVAGCTDGWRLWGSGLPSRGSRGQCPPAPPPRLTYKGTPRPLFAAHWRTRDRYAHWRSSIDPTRWRMRRRQLDASYFHSREPLSAGDDAVDAPAQAPAHGTSNCPLGGAMKKPKTTTKTSRWAGAYTPPNPHRDTEGHRDDEHGTPRSADLSPPTLPLARTSLASPLLRVGLNCGPRALPGNGGCHAPHIDCPRPSQAQGMHGMGGRGNGEVGAAVARKRGSR